MTILPDPLSPAATQSAGALARAAEAAAAVLPAVSPLTPVAPTPGNLGSAMGFAAPPRGRCHGLAILGRPEARVRVAGLSPAGLGGSRSMCAGAMP